MGRATLVVMAAGLGSRFGEGIKQLEPVGPNGEIIMEYSVYDAIEAGFDKVVFVIRKDLEKDFKRVVGRKFEEKIEVAYAYQEMQDIPEKYKNLLEGRQKPWGTGQAILSCKDVVDSPFVVINADDYYGKQAYKETYRYLTEETSEEGMEICMVVFVLKNTLSENGTVTRGICRVNGEKMLEEIVETRGIEKCGQKVIAHKAGGDEIIDEDSPVSMNMWGLRQEFFDILENGFDDFLSRIVPGDVTAEYLLPTIIGGLLKEKKISVKVLESGDRWFGVTYKEDKEGVAASIRELVQEGAYPAGLSWGQLE